MVYRLLLVSMAASFLMACGAGDEEVMGVGAQPQTELECYQYWEFYYATEGENIRIDANNCIIYIYNQPRRIRLYGSDNTMYTEPGVRVDDRGDGNLIAQDL
ncbi:MAG: hypothetical protein CMI09_05550 [Oceanospirillaceae bacterium]|nr:hypothetical protein [Oceanospirillaceae bacterium]|tara:strand:+ start:1828 stop:2133 length:306 start_codon:yes stop_codon:yes gene_type:complete